MNPVEEVDLELNRRWRSSHLQKSRSRSPPRSRLRTRNETKRRRRAPQMGRSTVILIGRLLSRCDHRGIDHGRQSGGSDPRLSLDGQDENKTWEGSASLPLHVQSVCDWQLEWDRIITCQEWLYKACLKQFKNKSMVNNFAKIKWLDVRKKKVDCF